jgi:hypothetical protein
VIAAMASPPPPSKERTSKDAEKPEGFARLEATVRQAAAFLEKQLIFVALVVGGLVIALTFWKSLMRPVPDSAVLVIRQLAVGLIVASIAAVFLPRLLKRDDLKNVLIDFVRQEVLDAISSATASLDAMQRVGITRVYATREEADADMARDLEARSKEIRLLGLSLHDMVDMRAPLRKSWETFERVVGGQDRQIPDVKVMLIDPQSLGAALRSQGEGDSGDTTVLARDVDQSLGALKSLARDHEAAGGKSFEYRLYRVAPQLFFALTDSVAYVQPYHFQRPPKDRGDTPLLPFLRCDDERLLGDLRNHFDLIWNFAAVPAEEWLGGHAVGTDEGAASAAVANVFSSPGKAASRMKWIIEEAAQRFEGATARTARDRGRLWLQGNSLDSYFRDGDLFEAVLEMVEREAEVHVLLLHPFCTQAQYRSYREYCLARQVNGEEVVAFSTYSVDDHPESTLVTDTKRTIKRILDIRPKYANLELKLYATAPFCFLLLTDDRAMVEQYHLGKYMRGQSPKKTQILGKDMPIVEYGKTAGGPSKWRPDRSPYALLENHFEFAWRLALDADKADLKPESGRERAHELEVGAALVAASRPTDGSENGAGASS